MSKIAIIGTGISGLTCAHYLHKQHDITLFEKNDYIGGHTATKPVELAGKTWNIDTGFIVFNDRTYPNFERLLGEINVKPLATEMSFSVRDDQADLEYCGSGINGLFAQRRNIVRPKYIKLLKDIVTFNKLAKADADIDEKETLADYLAKHNLGDWFRDKYLVPMGSAIWSASEHDMMNFPAQFFVRFFKNHGLLDLKDRPQWYVLEGGSNSYIEPLTRPFKDRIHLNSHIETVQRNDEGVTVVVNGEAQQFDKVIFACHSDQALALINTPSTAEKQILGAMPYADNEVIMHTDASALPKRETAWSAWNYLVNEAGSDQPVTLTYNMNILQRLPQPPVTFCVSLNNKKDIDPSKILGVYHYAHPLFTIKGEAAKRRHQDISGHNHSYFCGAYWRNGFHEDGVVSALNVCKQLGIAP